MEGLAAQVDLSGQSVLMRVDLNVPLDKEDPMKVTDDTRLRAIVPSAKFLLDKGAKLILMSQCVRPPPRPLLPTAPPNAPSPPTPSFGRPKGEIIETGKNGRLTPVVPRLTELLGTKVTKADDCMGPAVESLAASTPAGEVLLLEVRSLSSNWVCRTLAGVLSGRRRHGEGWGSAAGPRTRRSTISAPSPASTAPSILDN